MNKKKSVSRQSSAAPNKQSPRAVPIVGLIVVAFIAGAVLVTKQGGSSKSTTTQSSQSANQESP